MGATTWGCGNTCSWPLSLDGVRLCVCARDCQGPFPKDSVALPGARSPQVCVWEVIHPFVQPMALPASAFVYSLERMWERGLRLGRWPREGREC